ncbi:glycosyltransferase [Trujillonella endophytica]|uniref:UDP-N-acetylglucosamine transferase subunit ALG13 n=1 Tax=Trujillonella endophytica TaxID=673521 RepID=A0A1H8W5A3_9ACTN|nr:glycosyltransferase [Trujillella endophytica]SEP22824.1 UDP-N-acetylglucosamine transferase subunit ALG13 [Trujillella endophytica]
MDTSRELGAGEAAAPSLDLAGQRVLFVASTGGHLTELRRLAPTMGAAQDSTWVTFDTGQSRSLLSGVPTYYVPYTGPRQLGAAAGAATRIARILAAVRPAAVVSTGAAVALSAFVAARARGIPCHYIESVARIERPSLTGRMVAGLRLAHLYTQHPSSADRRWRPHRSVFAGFAAVPPPRARALVRRPRLFVTVGTIRPYRFDALVDRVLRSGLADERTVWQLGATTRHDLPGRTIDAMDANSFLACATEADLVISHAGVGTALTLFEAGIRPIFVPRRAHRGEHVDDHQTQIAAMLATTGLVTVAEVDDLHRSFMGTAVGWRIRALDSTAA